MSKRSDLMTKGPERAPHRSLLRAEGFTDWEMERPIIGIAKDEPLTAWLDHAVNPYTGFINARRAELTEKLGCTPQLVTYLMARVCDIHYGITTSMVHHCNYNKHHCEDIARANEAAGTTMIVAIGGQDRFYTPDLLEQNIRAMHYDLQIQIYAAAVIRWLKRLEPECRVGSYGPIAQTYREIVN